VIYFFESAIDTVILQTKNTILNQIVESMLLESAFLKHCNLKTLKKLCFHNVGKNFKTCLIIGHKKTCVTTLMDLVFK
jgi:hypothetical protein